ncbi:MAG: AtpZ/AtpI family protein [Phycisphaerae bacterium]
MPRNDKAPPRWIRYSGLGLEFAAAVVGFTAVGYWIDWHYKSAPKGVLIGAGLGIIGGGYNFLRASLAAVKHMEEQRTKAPHDEHDA